MGVARIAVLALAAVAAVFVGIYVRNQTTPPEVEVTPVVQTTEVVEMPTSRVLAARRDILPGQRLTPDDLVWQPWPEHAVSEAYLSNATHPTAITDFVGAVSRVEIVQGEPIIARRLVMPGEAGFMAAILTPGMRAVSIPISVETGAGGFILPGDRVDVILTNAISTDNSASSRNTQISRTILENIRILAIDQFPTRDETEQVVIGSTATLEVLPEEAETIALAERLGDIQLSLRSVSDMHPDADLFLAGAPRRRGAGINNGLGDTMTIYRYGQPSRVVQGAGG